MKNKTVIVKFFVRLEIKQFEFKYISVRWSTFVESTVRIGQNWDYKWFDYIGPLDTRTKNARLFLCLRAKFEVFRASLGSPKKTTFELSWLDGIDSIF